MWSRLVRTVAPAVKALGLEDAKTHLRVDGEDSDARIQSLIDAVIAEVEGPRGVGLAMIAQTWRLSLDGFPEVIELPLGPVISVTSVTYVDAAGTTQTLSPGLYQVSTASRPATVRPAYGLSWPTARLDVGAVEVTFQAGYGATSDALPPDLRSALRLLVQHYDDAAPRDAADRILNRYRLGQLG